MSSGVPMRPQGMSLLSSSICWALKVMRSPGVSIQPGLITLTLILDGASSPAMVRPRWAMAAFAML